MKKSDNLCDQKSKCINIFENGNKLQLHELLDMSLEVSKDG